MIPCQPIIILIYRQTSPLLNVNINNRTYNGLLRYLYIPPPICQTTMCMLDYDRVSTYYLKCKWRRFSTKKDCVGL